VITSVVPIEVQYQDDEYVDVATYITTDDGDWKMITTLDRATHDIYQSPIYFARAEENFVETKKPIPAEVQIAYNEVKPAIHFFLRCQ
jgi:hypothetical protein